MFVCPVHGPPIETAKGALALGVDVVAGDGDGQPPAPVCASAPRDGASPRLSAASKPMPASAAPAIHAAQRPLPCPRMCLLLCCARRLRRRRASPLSD